MSFTFLPFWTFFHTPLVRSRVAVGIFWTFGLTGATRFTYFIFFFDGALQHTIVHRRFCTKKYIKLNDFQWYSRCYSNQHFFISSNIWFTHCSADIHKAGFSNFFTISMRFAKIWNENSVQPINTDIPNVLYYIWSTDCFLDKYYIPGGKERPIRPPPHGWAVEPRTMKMTPRPSIRIVACFILDWFK